MILREAQERALRNLARQTGRFHDLLCFYAIAGEWEPFHETGRALGGADALAYRLFGLDQSPEHAPWVLEHVREAQDPLYDYTLTKFFLRGGDLKSAMTVVRNLLAEERLETLPLNLVARYMACTGNEPVALRLIDNSLAINRDQKDMSLLRERITTHRVEPSELYLAVAPKRVGVTFYTPAYNVEGYLRETLEALITQNYPLEEILVVNDGSLDDTVKIAREFPVRLIDFGENRGLAAARNAGFRESRTPFVGSVDADVCADPGYASHILMEFENADPELAGVGGRLIERYVDTPADAWRAWHLRQGWFPRRMYFDRLPADLSQHLDVEECDIFFLNGCNNVFRREAVLQAGGYDEKYRTNSEDSTMCVALRQAGYHLAFTRSAISRHSRRDTPQSVVRTAWNYGFSAREARGLYHDVEILLRLLHYSIDIPLRHIAADCEAGAFGKAYINVLVLFQWPLLDIAHSVKVGVLSKEQGAYMQQALLEMGGQLEGRLGERVLRDSVHLLIEAKGARESLTSEMQELWDSFMSVMGRYIGALPAGV